MVERTAEFVARVHERVPWARPALYVPNWNKHKKGNARYAEDMRDEALRAELLRSNALDAELHAASAQTRSAAKTWLRDVQSKAGNTLGDRVLQAGFSDASSRWAACRS